MSERGETNAKLREYWEYRDLTGHWNEPDESREPDEAYDWARQLGTAWRRVTVVTHYKKFEIND